MIQEHKLDNGLTILTKEVHHAPVISHWIWYRVGSRNEKAGETGISHWVEHMQFKGTQKYPINILDAEISRVGGMWNAMTYLDWTTYYETLPADQIDIALDLEADRMVNSIFDPDETELERTVVISEREGNENEPLFKLSEVLRKAAFTHHPYGEQVIGEMTDLRSITRDQLYQHYQRYYSPSNAVLSIAGDFDTPSLLEKIREKYSHLKNGYDEEAVIQPEPSLENGSRVVVEGPGDTLFIELAYRAPAAKDADFLSLMVLDSVLSGPSSLSMFGGGSISNKTSRLYQQLVEKDLAMSVSGSLQTTIDPYMYSILAIASPGQDINTIIKTIDSEIARLMDKALDEDVIERAVKQAKALFAYGSESITNQAFWMGYSSMFAQHDWFDSYIENISNVSSSSILETARKYLQPEKRVIGIYQPSGVR